MNTLKSYIYAFALLCGTLTATAGTPTEWVDLGEGKMTDDITTLYENYDAPTYTHRQ